MTTSIYGRLPSISTKKDSIVVDKKVYGVKYPMKFSDIGSIFSKSSDISLVKSNLRQLLMTSKGERVMLPDFGTNIKYYLFEPLDRPTFSQIRSDILNSVNKYIPQISLLKITVVPNDKVNYEGVQGINITLVAAIKDTKESFDLTVGIG